MRFVGLLIVAATGAWAFSVGGAGCSASNSSNTVMTPTVQPLTESEFDTFADDIADQLHAWLERGDLQPPVTVAPPTINTRSVESRGVARAFSTRLADGLSDRLFGVVRFRRSPGAKPRLRCEVAFSKGPTDLHARTIEFRLWDADSNNEICSLAQDYRARLGPAEYAHENAADNQHATRPTTQATRATATQVDRPEDKAATPQEPRPTVATAESQEASAQTVAVARVANQEPAETVQASARIGMSPTSAVSPATEHEASRLQATKRTGPITKQAAATAVTPPRTPATSHKTVRAAAAANKAAPTARVVNKQARGKTTPPPIVRVARVAPKRSQTAPISAAARSGSILSITHPRTPPKRKIAINRNERGLSELVADQAPYYRERTLRRESGAIVFLDRHSWRGLRVLRSDARRPGAGDRFAIELQLQARARPIRADIRMIYLDAQGRQIEVSAVRTLELSPGYASELKLRASNPGAASYIMLVARG